MILLWLCSQQWWITISIMATAWNHNCKCICFPLILVLLIEAPCYGSITKEQRFPADLFLVHSGSTNCSFAVYSFKWWKFGIKVNSLSDTVYLVIKCVPLYTALRLWCLCWDCFVLPVTEEITHLFPASISFLTRQTSMLPRTTPALSLSSSFQQRAKDCFSPVYQRYSGLICTHKFYLI